MADRFVKLPASRSAGIPFVPKMFVANGLPVNRFERLKLFVARKLLIEVKKFVAIVRLVPATLVAKTFVKKSDPNSVEPHKR